MMAYNWNPDSIINENVRKMVGITPIADESRECKLRWFGDIQERLVNATARQGQVLCLNDDAKARGWKDLN